MKLKDCKIGDVVWVKFTNGNEKYLQVKIYDSDIELFTLVKTLDEQNTLYLRTLTTECWEYNPDKYSKKTFYIRLEWPDYQEYQDRPGFDDNSVYDAENNTYFIKVNWLKSL